MEPEVEVVTSNEEVGDFREVVLAVTSIVDQAEVMVRDKHKAVEVQSIVASGHLLSNGGGYPKSLWDTFNSYERAQVYQMREARGAREETEKCKAASGGTHARERQQTTKGRHR